MDNKKLEMAIIFGVEIGRFKKKLSLIGLILSIPILFMFPLWFLVYGPGTEKPGWLRLFKDSFVSPGSDDVYWFTLLAGPIFLITSLVHYKSRESIYKAWLYTSAAALILLIGILMMYIIDPPGSGLGGPNLAGLEFALLGILYTSISVIIWLYGFFTRKRDKNNT